MEQYEVELITEHIESDLELKTLWELHLGYETLLNKLSSKPFLSPAEDQEEKALKKKKLLGKTRILNIISGYKD